MNHELNNNQDDVQNKFQETAKKTEKGAGYTEEFLAKTSYIVALEEAKKAAKDKQNSK